MLDKATLLSYNIIASFVILLTCMFVTYILRRYTNMSYDKNVSITLVCGLLITTILLAFMYTSAGWWT